MKFTIIVIKIESREDNAATVQKILTAHGCAIKVRLGLHDLPSNACSSTGLIILEVEGEEIGAMVKALEAVAGVSVKKIEI